MTDQIGGILAALGEPEGAAVVWAMGVLQELESLGLTLQGNVSLSPKGIHLYDQLTQDFEPDDEMLSGAVVELCDEDCWQEMMAMLMLYRDDRKALHDLADSFRDAAERMADDE